MQGKKNTAGTRGAALCNCLCITVKKDYCSSYQNTVFSCFSRVFFTIKSMKIEILSISWFVCGCALKCNKS